MVPGWGVRGRNVALKAVPGHPLRNVSSVPILFSTATLMLHSSGVGTTLNNAVRRMYVRLLFGVVGILGPLLAVFPL